jgi:serine/threonine-protein kinase
MSAALDRAVCRACGRTFASGERFCPYDRTELERASKAGDPLLGTVIAGSFTLLERLGSGGMGVVYRARQNRLERDVALKVLLPLLGTDRASIERFRVEAVAVSHLSDPHTVEVYDFGWTEEGLPYLAMELVAGDSLRARIQRGPMPVRTAVYIAMQILESLAEAHGRTPPLIHRDVKPENIIVRTRPFGDDFVTVLDFGLAKLVDAERLTAAGTVLGTPTYMAPEQARTPDRLDERLDLYSLGVVLHEMIAGRPPFSAPTPAALLYSHVWDPPPPLRDVRMDGSVPEDLEKIVLDLLEKEPGDRPASAHLVRTQLQDVLRRLPEAGPHDSTPIMFATPASHPAAQRPPVLPATFPAIPPLLISEAVPLAPMNAPLVPDFDSQRPPPPTTRAPPTFVDTMMEQSVARAAREASVTRKASVPREEQPITEPEPLESSRPESTPAQLPEAPRPPSDVLSGGPAPVSLIRNSWPLGALIGAAAVLLIVIFATRSRQGSEAVPVAAAQPTPATPPPAAQAPTVKPPTMPPAPPPEAPRQVADAQPAKPPPSRPSPVKSSPPPRAQKKPHPKPVATHVPKAPAKKKTAHSGPPPKHGPHPVQGQPTTAAPTKKDSGFALVPE